MSAFQTAIISLAQYERMMEAGVFDGEFHQRVELIQGEIRQMNPIGVRHANSVTYLTEWSSPVLQQRLAHVRVQQPVLLPESNSAPEPDVVWCRRRQYDRHPLPEDVLLLIEVSDATLHSDCGSKAMLYSSAGIEDYWVVNLVDDTIEVFRDPTKLGFKSRTTHARGESVAPLSYPELTLRVDDSVDPDLS